MTHRHATAVTAVVTLVLALTAAPALAKGLPAERYRALDSVYTAFVAFDGGIQSPALVTRTARTCARLDRRDGLLGPLRTACLATVRFGRATLGLRCPTRPACRTQVAEVINATSAVIDSSRAGNRAIARYGVTMRCKYALRTTAEELKSLSAYREAYRVLGRALQSGSQKEIDRAQRLLLEIRLDDGLTGAQERTRFRGACKR